MQEPQNDQGSVATISFFLLFAIALAVLLVGLVSLSSTGRTLPPMLSVGLIAVMIPIAVLVLHRRNGDSGASRYTSMRTAMEQNEEMLKLLRSINDRLLISDRAKQFSYRAKDRQVLREAIAEDMRHQEYDAAMVLVDVLANTYGYREEAETFRQQIVASQAQHQQQMLSQSVAKVDAFCSQGHFDQAMREVERLRRLYPQHPLVTRLPIRVDKARAQRKRDLERQFLRASEVGDFDKAMKLLKEMDTYLSPEEAEPYLEIARGVIGQKKENLGVQFRMRVQDRDWIGAMHVGEQIIKEFPNSNFASEVRNMIDDLRLRAMQQHAAMTGQPLPAAAVAAIAAREAAAAGSPATTAVCDPSSLPPVESAVENVAADPTPAAAPSGEADAGQADAAPAEQKDEPPAQA